MSPISLTMGIDLASQARDTAVCLLAWEDGRPTLLTLRRGKAEDGTVFHDKWLSTTAYGIRGDYPGPITKVGIDDPFGWPDEFVDAVHQNRSTGEWPSGIDESRQVFCLRETDRIVHARTGKRPLSVSSDRIASPAMRCAVLLTDIGRHLGAPAVARDGSGLCCEVYPDPALRFWTDGILRPRASYKGPDKQPKRVALLEALIQKLPIDDPNGELGAVSREDDHIDALICALMARAVEIGRSALPESVRQRERAATEGWIHLPTHPLQDLSGLDPLGGRPTG